MILNRYGTNGYRLALPIDQALLVLNFVCPDHAARRSST